MELVLGLVCDDARATPEGKLDVQGVFNDLYAPGFPAKQDHMVLVLAMEWDRDDQGRFQFRVDLKGPDGRPSLTVDGHTEVDRRPPERPPARTRLVMPLEEVVFPEAGTYRFEVRMKGRTFEGPALHLVEQDAPPASGTGTGDAREGYGPLPDDQGDPGAAPGTEGSPPGDTEEGPEDRA